MDNQALTNRKIIENYSGKSGNKGMGCANLQPFFNIRRGDIVLDLGCGTGTQAMKLHEIVGENGFIYGIDITGEMIEEAKRANDRSNIRFMTGDIHELPLVDGQVDVVLSNCVINHSLKKEKVYTEIFRVLKPGGHFLIGDVMAVEELPDRVKNNPEYVAGCWGGAIPKRDYFELIVKAGFVNLVELGSRQYVKNDFLLESIIIKGEKK